jgi:hypothetical protein
MVEDTKAAVDLAVSDASNDELGADKLVGWALTAFSILLPIISTILTVASDPSQPDGRVVAAKWTMLFFAPLVIGLGAYIIACFAQMAGYVKLTRITLLTAIAIVIYSICGLLSWMLVVIIWA